MEDFHLYFTSPLAESPLSGRTRGSPTRATSIELPQLSFPNAYTHSSSARRLTARRTTSEASSTTELFCKRLCIAAQGLNIGGVGQSSGSMSSGDVYRNECLSPSEQRHERPSRLAVRRKTVWK